MALSRVLRRFLLADALLTTTSIVISFVMPETAVEEAASEPALFIVSAVIAATLLVAWLAALVGLWRLRNWARAVYLGVAGLGIVGTLLAGGETGTGLEDALSSVCWLVTGIIIALVYWSPLASTFHSGVRAA